MTSSTTSWTGSRPVHHGPFAGEPLGHVIDRIYTSDIYMHSWDLARAGAIRADLDPAYARTLLESMRPIESLLRSSGHYGPPTHTDSTDPVDQLMAFVGRRTQPRLTTPVELLMPREDERHSGLQ